MKVLVAGDRGYIGVVLVPFLRTAGHEVQDDAAYERGRGLIEERAPWR